MTQGAIIKNKYNLYILFVFVCTLLLPSCVHKCDIKCVNSHFLFSTVGYTPNELDTTILITFVKNSNFSWYVDSFILTGVGSSHTFRDSFSDTVDDERCINTKVLDSSQFYDYEYCVPSTNRVYKISNINFSGDKVQNVACPGDDPNPNYCFMYISSYSIDNMPNTYHHDNNYDVDFIFLIK